MSTLILHALPDGTPEANAAAILAGLVSWWALDDNAATPSFADSHGGHTLTLRLGATTPNSSTQSSATAKAGRAWASGRADNGMLYIPRANTALDMITDAVHTFGGWFKLDFTGGVTAFVIGRIGSAFNKLHLWITIDSADGLIKARYSANGTTTTATASSTIAVSGPIEWCLIVASYNRTAGTLTIRARKETTGAMGSGSVALGAAVSTVADACNFTIGEGLESDTSYDAANNRSAVLTADECFYGAFAMTDAIFDYLFNAGAGRSYAQVVADTHVLPRGGFKLYESAGKLGIKVAHNASAAAYWSAWETSATFAPGSFRALAFEIQNGVPRIFVDGVEQAGAFVAGDGSQASFIGLDTTQTGHPLRIGGFDGWLDELSVKMDEAIYTGDYTPETEPFPDDDEGGSTPGDLALLILDRALDWDGTPEPHAVMLSSEVNGVSAALSCERGDADHEVQLLEAAPFELFGKGDHQEPTRVSFGTVDNIVRDWIVRAAEPRQGVGVHVEAITYNPDVYTGAMPHQGGAPLPVPLPPGVWMIAGTPLTPSLESVCIGGTPDDPSADSVLAGVPSDPSTWLEDAPP